MRRFSTKAVLALVLALVMALACAAPGLAAETSVPYEGDSVNFIKEDGSQFGMFTPQDGTTVKLDVDTIAIHFVPKNTTVYNGIHFGFIDDAELTADVAANEDGSFDITLSADKAGTCIPVAPIKAKDGETTKDQYYLAIPTAEKLSGTDFTCVATRQDLKVDEEVKETEVYNIDGYNYFKLRDMAALLNGTKAQFSVDFDAEKKEVYAVTGEEYEPVGGELETGTDKSASCTTSVWKFFANGEEQEVAVYNIGGNNFFKLRDLGNALGFYVDYVDPTMLVFSEITEEYQAAADEVAALIDAIYVQEWTEETDAQCAAAKAAWDELTELQKKLVEGEEADPDYFGRDTGDASLDDPRNADEIGEKEILVVSFGTSFNDSRVKDIKSIEDAIAAAFPEWSVRRAFTAQIIINHIQARDGEKIDNMIQALDRAVANGVKTLVIQPTHLMHGAEYDELCEAAAQYADKMEITIAEPLLGEVGADATVINEDKAAVAEYVTVAAVASAKSESLEDAAAHSTAFVFMGHGTSHTANVTYSQMQTQMDALGYKNVFIGTVEGLPESTACEAVIEAVKAAGYTNVILRPLMVVAGDHANNDMADEEDEESWYSMFTAAGLSVKCQIEGLGRIEDVQKLYVAHTQAAIGDEAAETDEAADKAAADEVAALIDAIYVQEWTEETDAQCAAAKEAWDKLTDAQKELVEGEEADPDYFGRDTGDASLDDPRNQDDIGEKEILVVSFGTSFNDSRVKDIKSIEDAIAAAFPEWSVRRAFTAQIIINHIQARDGEKIDNMIQALDRAVANGVKTLVIQPTHLMHGAEYDEMCEAVAQYADKMEIKIAEPLLGEVGADATVINEDKAAVAEYVTAAAVASSEFETLEAADEAKTAFVFMGHGTSHTANVTYSQMQTQMGELGYKNVFIGTVEGLPESTACEAVIEAVKAAGYTNVILRPLMVVAGDHANNDMADEEDEESWYSMFKAAELEVTCQIEGLGRIEDVQKLYVAHTQTAIDGEAVAADEGAASEPLADGTYLAKFKTDHGMFHANDYVNDGKSVLTVKDGKMTIHVVLAGVGYSKLFLGSKEDAQKDGADVLTYTEETVTYTDGSPDSVAYGFDIPVEALDTEFACASYGVRGEKWYDHTVSVTDVVAQ